MLYSKIRFNWLHLKLYPNLTAYQLLTAVKLSEKNVYLINLVRGDISNYKPSLSTLVLVLDTFSDVRSGGKGKIVLSQTKLSWGLAKSELGNKLMKKQSRLPGLCNTGPDVTK